MNLTEQQKTVLRRLFEDNGLVKDDIHSHKHYIIIKRGGIEKIRDKHGFTEEVEIIDVNENHAAVLIELFNSKGTAVGREYGTCNNKNHPAGYYLEVAIKRARARAVLSAINAYKYGVFGWDEGVQDGNEF